MERSCGSLHWNWNVCVTCSLLLQDLQELGIDLDGSFDDGHGGPGELDVSFGKKDAIIIDVS